MGRTTTASRAIGTALAAALLAHAAAAQALTRAGDSAQLVRALRLPSPRTATWITIGATVLPAVAGAAIASRTQGSAGTALSLAGLVAGPAVGAWYGGTLSSSWNGIFLRTGGIALAAAGAAGCSGGAHAFTGCTVGEETAMIGGAALALGSAIYEMAQIGERVREHNDAQTRAIVLPLFSPSMREVGVEVVVGF